MKGPFKWSQDIFPYFKDSKLKKQIKASFSTNTVCISLWTAVPCLGCLYFITFSFTLKLDYNSLRSFFQSINIRKESSANVCFYLKFTVIFSNSSTYSLSLIESELFLNWSSKLTIRTSIGFCPKYEAYILIYLYSDYLSDAISIL